MLERFGITVMHRLDPERAHGLAIKALKAGLGPRGGAFTSPRLKTRVAGLDLPNPVGLAAGFDKNAEVAEALDRAGFGFIELGAATPLPQPGNPRPRLFRLARDRAAINRFGFNNDGMVAIAARLAAVRGTIPMGLNLGANKDSTDRAGDFSMVLETCGAHVNFATVNVSSPNTERLRDLQGRAALSALLARVMETRAASAPECRIFLKIAPDLDRAALEDIADLALEKQLDGIIATNTTLSRDGLTSPQAHETGGLSGQPLFERATRVLAQLSELTDGRLPLIGVGGVGNVTQAYEKIRAGASAVQLYTGLVYSGMSLATHIARGLDDRMARDGIGSIAELTATGRSAWL